MADNNTERIFIDTDFNNITVVDPNKVFDSNNAPKDRYIKQEDLVIYANLECTVLPRTKLAVGVADADSVQTISIAQINFLNPGKKNFLDNEYTNEITGENTLKGGGVNQRKIDRIPQTKDEAAYYIQKTLNQSDNGLLGITQISIRQGTDFTPLITINLEDIRGRALFEAGADSPYGAFFHLPYPPFYLTMKGYFGKAVRLTLMLSKFNARYDSLSGNFKVTLDFYTYKYSVLVETPMAHLLAVPYMYPKEYKLSSANSTAIPTSPTITINTSLGKNKLDEVYTSYIQKGLIPENFPKMSIKELYELLSRYIDNELNGFLEANLQPLTNIELYAKALNRYDGEVYSFGVDPTTKIGAWFELFIDKKNFYVLKNTKQKIYHIRKGLKVGEVTKLLDQIVTDYNSILAKNETVGANGKYVRQSSGAPISSSIPNKITKDIFIYFQGEELTDADIDAVETYKLKKNVTSVSQFQENSIIEQFKKDNIDKSERVKGDLTEEFQRKITWYIFDGDDRFNGLIETMKKQLETIKQQIQEDLTLRLSELLQEQKTLGFVPNIRNILAVFFANGEAFLKLMDKVHRDAYKVRDSLKRVAAVFNPDSPNADKVNINDKIVYPWPQLVVKKTTNEGDIYELKYPGEKTLKDGIDANNYETWPEVEFVEEYIKSLVQRVGRDTKINNVSSQTQDIKRLSINAIEYPISNEIYFDQQTVKFIYEIFERFIYTIYFSNINKDNQDAEVIPLITEIETTNIKESLENGAPELIFNLRNLAINSSNYEASLKEISNSGIGFSWINWERAKFNTNYISNKSKNSFELIPINKLSKINTTPTTTITEQNKTNLDGLLKKKTNKITFTDTYPFTNSGWLSANLENGINTSKDWYDTTNVLIYNSDYKVISNFSDIQNKGENKPFTNFKFKDISTIVIPSYSNLKQFYNDRYSDYEKQIVTEGNIASIKQTTSIFNTPFFINAIQKGVANQKNRSTYPYVSAAYLFLNSLPLITCREKLKTLNGNEANFNYIAATLKKYGAIHSVPYSWILKIGSIWHRYKNFIDNGIDILDDVWTNFDYINNYDPTTQNPKKVYSFTSETVGYNIVLEDTNTASTTNINVGFYPKLFNDFSYFYVGSEIIKNSYLDEDITDALNKNLKFKNYQDANFSYPKEVDSSKPLRTIKFKSWSFYYSGGTEDVYLFPGVGAINQTKTECFKDSEIEQSARLQIELTGNTSMYNGSVKQFWNAPNYGYFDVSKTNRPNYTQYLKYVSSISESEQNFELGGIYSDISEIFGIFDWKVLNYFEREFLNFSKDSNSFTTSLTNDYSNNVYYNFQLLMKNMMKISAQSTSGSLDALTENQSKKITSTIIKFLEENIIFKFGNPTFFDRQLFYSFSNLPIQDKSVWDSYIEKTPNSLPPQTLLSTSQINNPGAWKALRKYVGFSLIESLRYKDTGSFITDFFIDMNMAFTESNVEKYSQIIKLYATQKLNQFQGTPVNTNTAPPTPIEVYRSKLVDGSDVVITQNGNIKTLKISGLIEFTFNYPATDENITIVNSALSIINVNPPDGVPAALVSTPPTTNLTLGSNNFSLNPSSASNNSSKIQFYDNMTSFINLNETVIDKIIDSLWGNLQKNLKDVKEAPKNVKESELKGEPQTKLELWEMFKALNDKWIAGNDYGEKTLFEDVLLLDRASRNVGEKVLIDIFSLKNFINPEKINMTTDLITYVESILVENNFVVMTLPSYINFYGIREASKDAKPEPQGIYEFANSLFGVHTNVDYASSSAKLVCMYAGKSSEYVDMDKINTDFRFKSDSFDLTKIADNPISENQANKTDWDKSNKVVGFNVEFGPENQQIFKNFSVGQNAGVATTESLEVLNQMANQGGGRNIATQNLSLYNLYKNRSYTCNLSMMGNAMIQPTMYFNLKYVPMFNGAYMITEVNHSISQGEFTTDIVGIRQPIASLPLLDNYLQALNTNLVEKIEELLPNRLKNAATPNNVITQNAVTASQDSNTTPSNDSECKPTLELYKDIDKITTTENTQIAYQQLKDTITKVITTSGLIDNGKLKLVIYSYLYFQHNDSSKNTISSYNNNFGGVSLIYNWGNLTTYFDGYYCNKDKTNTVSPMAVFANPELQIQFFVDWWKNRVSEITPTLTDENQLAQQVTKFIATNRIPNKILSAPEFENYSKSPEYSTLLDEIKKAVINYKTLI